MGWGELLFKQVDRNMKKEYSIHNRYLILYSLMIIFVAGIRFGEGISYRR